MESNRKNGPSSKAMMRGCLFPAAPTSRLRYCFETLPDGRIPVVNDFNYVMNCLAAFPTLCIQAEHAYGRISMFMDREEFVSLFVSPVNLDVASTDLSKAVQCHEIWAKLEECSCCGSSGEISFFNSFGLRFLQICAPRDIDPREWAQFLAMVAVAPHKELEPGQVKEPNEMPHPVMPAGVKEFDLSKKSFIKLLEKIAISEEMFQFTLPTSRFSLGRSFSLHQIYEEDGCLVCHGNKVGYLLSLRAVKSFAVQRVEGVETLYLLGSNYAVIFEITMRERGESVDVWHGILETARNSSL
jgi:hypothetical protein